MSAVEKIKLAAAELGPDEQYELFRWWTESDEFRKRQLSTLKVEIDSGIEDLNEGRQKAFDDTNTFMDEQTKEIRALYASIESIAGQQATILEVLAYKLRLSDEEKETMIENSRLTKRLAEELRQRLSELE